MNPALPWGPRLGAFKRSLVRTENHWSMGFKASAFLHLSVSLSKIGRPYVTNPSSTLEFIIAEYLIHTRRQSLSVALLSSNK